MKSNYKQYDLNNSIDRIEEILNASDSVFVDRGSIPSRSELSYSNGFYVNCSALFVDIRESSEFTDFHKTRVLSRIYRAYISEVVAIMNSNSNCQEINVKGDGVSGIFNTAEKSDIDGVFSTGAEISSVIDILNCKLKARNLKQLTVGIGIAYGRALMVMAGYKGSGINDIIWVGDVVNEASNLANYGNRDKGDFEIMVSKIFQQNLNDTHKELLKYNERRACYHGNIINKGMNSWVDRYC